jgi:hypothetical protein
MCPAHGVLEDSRSISAITKLKLSRLARFHELRSRIVPHHSLRLLEPHAALVIFLSPAVFDGVKAEGLAASGRT